MKMPREVVAKDCTKH